MHVIAEKRMLRMPGRFELSWTRLSLACELIYSSGEDDRWPWMLHLHVLWLNVFLHFPCRFMPKSKRGTVHARLAAVGILILR